MSLTRQGLMMILAFQICRLYAGTMYSVSAGASAGGPGCSFSSTITAACDDASGVANAVANAHVNTGVDVGTSNVQTVLEESFGDPSQGISAGASAQAQVSDIVNFFVPGFPYGFVIVHPNFTGDFFVSCTGTVLGRSLAECSYATQVTDIFTVPNNGSFAFVRNGGPGAIDLVGTDQHGPSTVSNSKTIIPYVSPDWIVQVPFNTAIGISYSLSVGASIDCNRAGGALPCPQNTQMEVTSDFSDPPTFEVLDSNMNPIPGATVLSADGIDYSGTAVPEPHLGWMVGAVVALLLPPALRLERRGMR
jgi:hypothetical protein